MNNWITTNSGKPVMPLDPKVDDIVIEDIAHALGMICRWAGHSRTFYSVAEHSLRVGEVCRNLGEVMGMSETELLELEMLGLMHDATEAYVGDIPRPLKSQYRIVTPRGVETFREVEAHLYGVIEQALGLPEMTERYAEIVHTADNIVLATEARDIAHEVSLKHEVDAQEPLEGTIKPFDWNMARIGFLIRYAELVKELDGGSINDD